VNKACVLLRCMPDPEANVRVLDDGSVSWGGMPPVPNTGDMSALELALRQREAGAIDSVSIVALEQDQKSVLRLGLAMGADEAITIDDAANGMASLKESAALLALFLVEMQATVFLCGHQSAEAESPLVAHFVSKKLGWPILTGVATMSIRATSVRTTRNLEKGWRETFEAPLPAVVAARESVAEPRYVGRSALARVARQSIRTWGSQTGVMVAPMRRSGRFTRPIPAPIFVPDSSLCALDRLEQVVSAGVRQSGGVRFVGDPAEVAVQFADFVEDRVGPIWLDRVD